MHNFERHTRRGTEEKFSKSSKNVFILNLHLKTVCSEKQDITDGRSHRTYVTGVHRFPHMSTQFNSAMYVSRIQKKDQGRTFGFHSKLLTCKCRIWRSGVSLGPADWGYDALFVSPSDRYSELPISPSDCPILRQSLNYVQRKHRSNLLYFGVGSSTVVSPSLGARQTRSAS